MTNVIRQLVETALEVMEAGRFQDFCLEFLPLWDTRFVGLSRLGHTAGGKTRPGTPDLILTRSDGSQIGVQCGTEEEYWKPTEDLANWKPYSDSKKCITTLGNLHEIVAIANREIPTNMPNTKSELISILRPETTATITPLAREDISQFVLTALHIPSIKNLLKAYCPDAFHAFENEEAAQRLQLGRVISSERLVEAKTLFRLIDESVQSYGNVEEAKQCVIEMLDELGYRLKALPDLDGIHRKSVEVLSLANPIGTIWSLVGVPKIGKTSLLLQLAKAWADFDLHWYDCPAEEQCAEAIVLDIIRTLLPNHDAGSLIRSGMRLDHVLKEAKSLTKNLLFVIDNAENLSESGLIRISDVVVKIKPHKVAPTLGIIFSSNRKLPVLSNVIDTAVVAPPWTEPELGDLLHKDTVPFDEANGVKYLELLEVFSGGHPLIAKALARKWPKVGELLVGQLTPLTKATDENLSREVQVLLYEDILKDADSQNLVQRLACLIGHTPEDILDILRIEVLPQISQSAKVIIEKVGGSVIEGDSTVGYSVPLVFKEIAKQRISNAETRQVHKVVGTKLVAPQGHTIDAGRATSGVFYLLCAGEFRQVYTWTAFLVGTALIRKLRDDQISALLDRLRFSSLLNSPEEFADQIAHGLMMLTLAMAHCHIRDYKAAREIIERIAISASPSTKRLDVKTARHIQIHAVLLKVLICIEGGFGSPLQSLSDVNVEDLFEVEAALRYEYLELLARSILRYSLDELAPALIRKIIDKTESMGLKDVDINTCFDIACNIGVRAKREERSAEFIGKFFIETKFGQLLKHLSCATLLIELRQSRDALHLVEETIAEAKELLVASAKCWSHLYQVKGDAAYQLEDKPLAEESYMQGLEYASSGSFDRAWASWRLGLLKNDEQMFAIAASEFRSKGHIDYWGRALGARGAVLISSGKKDEGVRCFHDVIDAYFASREEAVGPAATLALSHLNRLKSELEGEPIDPTDSHFPNISAPLYEKILELARPLSGPMLSYYMLAKVYRQLGKEEDSRACVREALKGDPSHPKDIVAIPIMVRDFVEILADPEKDRSYLKVCVHRAISSRQFGGDTPLSFMIYCVFQKADTAYEADRASKLFPVLVSICEEILEGNPSDEAFWRSEVCVRRARIIKTNEGFSLKAKRQYVAALNASLESRNSRVMIESSHALGFDFISLAGSLKELADYQFSQVQGVELEADNFDRLNVLGSNLFNLWGRIDWKRLRETDLSTKKLLFDPAHEMKRRNTSIRSAAPAMVLLLVKLYNHSGPGTEWAKAQLPIPAELPEEVSVLLEFSK